MKKPQPVVHFEMPYEDAQRVSTFYSDTFGWNLQTLGQEMGKYVLAQTTETDENQMVQTPGAINGGFYPKKDAQGPASTHLVISVDNLEDSIAKVKDGGGEIIGEPMDIPGIGRFVMIHDTEGNRIGMLQPSDQQA